jgi:hypothetical protein
MKKQEDDEENYIGHNAGRHKLYCSGNMIIVIVSRRTRLKRGVPGMVEMKNAFKIIFGRPRRKRPLGRPWRRWEGNIKMYPKEII